MKKLYTFVPVAHAEAVRSAIFLAGGGHIGNYSECSFNAPGTGTFKASGGANPFVGEIDKRNEEAEIKIEVIFPAWLEMSMITALKQNHPYEVVAFDIVSLENQHQEIGSGIIGDLPGSVSEQEFLKLLQIKFELKVIRHTHFLQKKVHKVAICGGAGSFLIKAALASGADAYVTGDVKYHEFFDAENKMLLTDIGHWESEQFTIDLLADLLSQKFPPLPSSKQV